MKETEIMTGRIKQRFLYLLIPINDLVKFNEIIEGEKKSPKGRVTDVHYCDYREIL